MLQVFGALGVRLNQVYPRLTVDKSGKKNAWPWKPKSR